MLRWGEFGLFRVGVLLYRSDSKMKKNKKSNKKDPKTTNTKKQNPKVNVDIFLEKLKLLKIGSKEDKAGNIGIKVNNRTITYIRRNQVGFRYQIHRRNSKGNLNWYGSDNVTTEKQMDDLIEGIKEFQKNNDDNVLIKLGFLDKDAKVKG